jgi:hypothetical protein
MRRSQACITNTPSDELAAVFTGRPLGRHISQTSQAALKSMYSHFPDWWKVAGFGSRGNRATVAA